jgi:hypothetical protein
MVPLSSRVFSLPNVHAPRYSSRASLRTTPLERRRGEDAPRASVVTWTLATGYRSPRESPDCSASAAMPDQADAARGHVRRPFLGRASKSFSRPRDTAGGCRDGPRLHGPRRRRAPGRGENGFVAHVNGPAVTRRSTMTGRPTDPTAVAESRGGRRHALGSPLGGGVINPRPEYGVCACVSLVSVRTLTPSVMVRPIRAGGSSAGDGLTHSLVVGHVPDQHRLCRPSPPRTSGVT